MAKVLDKTKLKKVAIAISPSIGKVSCLINEARQPKAVIALAHGAGAGMTHSFMESLAEELCLNGFSVVRFNFPFIENKKKRPDPPAVAEKTIAVVAENVHERFPDLPMYVSGKSFGGRMTSQWLSKNAVSFVKGIIFYGFPLHAPGKDGIERAEHLKTISLPMLFLQGTRDALANIDLMRKVVKKLKKATLVELEGADHSFKKGKNLFIKELVDESTSWITG